MLKMATANEIEPMLNMGKLSSQSSRAELFAFDEETTDVVFCVEDKKLHLSRGVLMQASPVFRKMLAPDGKEKQNEVTLPDKPHQEVVLFLRCVCPMEYVKLNEGIIDVVLPLAKEYQVNSLLQKCEDWLLTEIEFIVGKVAGHVKETQTMVEFFAKCLLYSTKNELESLYNRAFELLVPYNLIRYQNTKFYKLLPDKIKWQLLEARLVKIEKTQYIGDGSFPEEEKDKMEIPFGTVNKAIFTTQETLTTTTSLFGSKAQARQLNPNLYGTNRK